MRNDAQTIGSLTARESGWLTPSIQKAHERSETFGLSASMCPDYDVLTHGELRMKLEQNRVLCAHATPVMETLREQIANTQSMIVLTDAEGLILHSIGDDDFLRRAEKVALKAGANWAEERQGTNAIGTAIAERTATVVHGDQHYLAANRFLTCSSVPILDPYGDLVGVLDVTGDHRSYHQHTMALAKMSVQMIENHLFANTFRNTLQIAFHGRPEFLGTLMEGIMAFTCDGRFLSANRSAQFQVGLPLQRILHRQAIGLFVALRAQRLHGWPLGGIEQAHLNEGAVGRAAHLAAERVDLAHEMTLGRPADGWIARHQGDTIEVHRQQEGASSHTRRRQRSLAAGMPRPDDDHVVAPVRWNVGHEIPDLVTHGLFALRPGSLSIQREVSFTISRAVNSDAAGITPSRAPP